MLFKTILPLLAVAGTVLAQTVDTLNAAGVASKPKSSAKVSSSILATSTSAAPSSTSAACSSAPSSTAPALTFLYTAFVNCAAPFDIGVVSEGDRVVIPIVGGNFTGPALSGTILDLGADWGYFDTKTGIFHPDTRYNFRTTDGANIWIRSTGSSTPNGSLQLRFLFETGAAAYYWLNNVVAIGTLRQVAAGADGSSVLRIDAWIMAGGNGPAA
ncbi:hypothetical protein EJ06DRAFT_504088 [Trichodelitschia bisporula]|uniref:Concanavalin A-like lectin/glucanase n=1 Tax=Trichodelitschia bisporula TaxID=703511 RepID=A0A6G1I9M3_9PEZI|nr:hypothetical protein EJ06DRAFT_504088 [Trichodelitschia bisporula]